MQSKKLGFRAAIAVLSMVAVELVMLGILGNLFAEMNRIAADIKLTSDIIYDTISLRTSINDINQDVIYYDVTKNQAWRKHYDKDMDRPLVLLQNLEEKIATNEESKQVLGRITKIIVDQIQKQFASQDESASADLAAVRRLASTTSSDFIALKDEMNTLLDLQQKRQSELTDQLERKKTDFERILWIDLIVTAIGALALFIALKRSVLDKLNILVEQVFEGSRNSTLQSTDEISLLELGMNQNARDLREAQTKVAAIVNNMNIGLLTVDHKQYIRSVNSKAAELLGYSAEDLSGKRLDDVLGNTGTKGGLADLIEKQSQEAYELRATTSSGEKLPVECSISPLPLQESHILVSIQDISDRFEADRLKQEFMSMVSHDIRAPLTYLQATLVMLEQDVETNLKDSHRERIGGSIDETNRLVRLVNDLLDLTRFESGAFQIAKKHFPVWVLLERSKNAVSTLAARRSVKLEIPACEIDAYGDIDRLEQVLINLLSNAISVSPTDGIVLLTVTEGETSPLEIRITDDGPGIDKSDQLKLFEQFTQIPLSGVERTGFGLGLSISKAIIDKHQGEIGVDSEPGKGCTFWFRLPEKTN